jgi:KinB signaling pathway activation protein
VTISNWWKLFWTTLLIGAGAALLVGLVLALGDAEFRSYKASEISYNLLIMAMAGLMFSILSQMGFFSYMTLNYIARDIFRKPSTWKLVQLFFIITVPFEIWFFLWNGSLLRFVIGVGCIFILSWLTAYWKVRMTNPTAWIPTLFFMFVATMLETAIAIQVNNANAALLMAVPLLACNAWQILKLHTLLKGKES